MSDDKKHCCGVFKEAWQKLKGMKRHFWGSVILFTLINVGAFVVLGALFWGIGTLFFPGFAALTFSGLSTILELKFVLPLGVFLVLISYHLAQGLFEMFVSLPMRMGIRLIPLRKVANKSVHALFLFKYFTWKYIWRFILLSVLLAIFVGIPAAVGIFALCAAHTYHLALTAQIACYAIGVFLLLYALYAIVNYLFVNLALIDRDIGAWQAMQLSRQAVVKKWFCVFGTLVWLAIVLMVGALLLGVGLIWAVPYTQNVIAILYRDLVGIEGKDPASVKGE